jgi:hypothetical protein
LRVVTGSKFKNSSKADDTSVYRKVKIIVWKNVVMKSIVPP